MGLLFAGFEPAFAVLGAGRELEELMIASWRGSFSGSRRKEIDKNSKIVLTKQERKADRSKSRCVGAVGRKYVGVLERDFLYLKRGRHADAVSVVSGSTVTTVMVF